MTAPDEIFVTSWHIPASIIAKWPPPNLVNPELRHGLIPLCAVLLVISTSFVAARIYARVTARAGQFGLDDVLIIAAWVRFYSQAQTSAFMLIYCRSLV